MREVRRSDHDHHSDDEISLTRTGLLPGKNGTLVDIMPDFGDFIIAECSSDGDKCHGVDNERRVTPVFLSLICPTACIHQLILVFLVQIHQQVWDSNLSFSHYGEGERNWTVPLGLYTSPRPLCLSDKRCNRRREVGWRGQLGRSPWYVPTGMNHKLTLLWPFWALFAKWAWFVG